LSDEELLIYEVAFHLKMPLYELVENMPYDEFLGWMNYFEKRPAEWRADDRAYKLLQTQGAKQKAWEIFPSLRPIYKSDKDKFNIGKSALSTFIRNSKDGDLGVFDESL